MKFNLGEGIYRIVNVITWTWVIFFLFVSYHTFKDNSFSFKIFVILFLLTFGVPFIFKKNVIKLEFRF